MIRRLRDSAKFRSAGSGHTVAAMDGLQGCQEQESLSQQERYLLEALPGAANEITFTILGCDLEAGHSGPHLAVGQLYGDRARWLQWVPGERRE